jgi:hypothetical protein
MGERREEDKGKKWIKLRKVVRDEDTNLGLY